MDWIFEPWPWYVSGPLIAVTMFLLLYMGNKLGMSSNLKTICSVCGAGNATDFFKFDWKAHRWNLIVMIGVVLGGFLAQNFLSTDTSVHLNEEIRKDLHALGFQSAGSEYLPTELFADAIFTDPKALILLIIGGLLIGFGARYANGCTSGHAISGLSNLQLPSLLAVIGFFIGGLLMTHIFFPLLF